MAAPSYGGRHSYGGPEPTFFAVMLVIMKSESIMTGALVAADSVLTDVLTSAVI